MTYSEAALAGMQTLLCGYAAFTDFRSRKIENLVSYGLLFVGVCAQVLWWMVGMTEASTLWVQFVGGGALVFALYWIGVFAAGDAKLLWALGLSLPPAFLKEPGELAAFVLGVNSFVPYGTSLLVYLTVKHRDRLRHASRTYPATLLKLLPDFAVFYLIFSLLFAGILILNREFSLRLQPLTVMMVSFGVYFPARSFALRYIRASQLAFLLLPAFVATLLLFNMPTRTLLQRGAFLVALLPLTAFLQLLMSAAARSVRVSVASPDLIPLERIVRVTANDGSHHYLKIPANEKPLATFDAIYPRGDRFTDTEREELRALDAAGRFESFGGTITVQHPIAFAPALFLGLVLTLLLKAPFYAQWVH